jgi:hypothetical protein
MARSEIVRAKFVIGLLRSHPLLIRLLVGMPVGNFVRIADLGRKNIGPTGVGTKQPVWLVG